MEFREILDLGLGKRRYVGSRVLDSGSGQERVEGLRGLGFGA